MSGTDPDIAASLSGTDQAVLLQVARSALRATAAGLAWSPPDSGGFSSRVCLPGSCFVTLRCGSRLRGCVGNLEPNLALWKAVAENTAGAALRDPRFPSVRSDEVGSIRIEISVLSPPQPIQGMTPTEILRQIDPRKHGVLLRYRGRVTTFLPQVWEQIPDKYDFMRALEHKADFEPDSWMSPEASISVYGAFHFEEP